MALPLSLRKPGRLSLRVPRIRDRVDKGEKRSSEPELLIRLMALHALILRERPFYIKEVEEIQIADAVVSEMSKGVEHETCGVWFEEPAREWI